MRSGSLETGSSLQTIQSHELSELAYFAIRDAILKGEFEAGTRLGQDELGAKLGVSRGPVRDALNRLALEGFVGIMARGSAVVVEMTERELRDIFEARALVDGRVARRTCQVITREQLDHLERIVESTRRFGEDGKADELVQSHTDFHSIIYAACPNTELARIGRNLWDRTFRYRAVGLRSRGVSDLGLEDHIRILQSFREGDAEQAEQLMVLHGNNTVELILQHLRLNSVSPPTQ